MRPRKNQNGALPSAFQATLILPLPRQLYVIFSLGDVAHDIKVQQKEGETLHRFCWRGFQWGIEKTFEWERLQTTERAKTCSVLMELWYA